MQACDALGLLVWVEFWITGDNNGGAGGGGSSEYPKDHQLFLLSAACVIRGARTHPSVALYVGGNEQVYEAFSY